VAGLPLVYVTANGGASSAGGIDILDVRDAQQPILRQAVTFGNGINFFSAYVDKDTLYLAGVVPQPLITPPECPTCAPREIPAGAVVFVLPLSTSTGLPIGLPRVRGVRGNVATDILAVGPMIYVTSALQGGLTVLDRATLEPLGFQQLFNPRAMSYIDNQSPSGALFVTDMDLGGGAIGFSSFMGGSATPSSQFAKNAFSSVIGDADIKGTVIADDARERLYASMGNRGIGVFYPDAGAPAGAGRWDLNPAATIPVLNITQTPFETATTQSVRPYGNYLMAANGGAGVALYAIDKSNGGAGNVGILVRPCYRPLGVMTINGQPFSANYIHGGPNYMYVAMGRGGLRVIQGQQDRPIPAGTCEKL